MENHNLTEEREWKGEFFLPNSKEKIPGILKYDDYFLTLNLFKTFPIEGNSYSTDNPQKIDILHGIIIHSLGPSERITLKKITFGMPFTYASVQSVFFGSHFDKDIHLPKIKFNFDLLNEWATSNFSLLKNNSDITTTIPDLHPEKFTFTRNDISCELFVSHSHTISSGQYVQSITANFTIDMREPQTSTKFEILFDYIQCVKFFLMLVMNRRINISQISIEYKQKSFPIYCSLDTLTDKASEHEHFFNLGYIKENYSVVLSNWANFYFENKYLLKVFFKTMESTRVEITDFFVYVALLEGFYKLKYPIETDAYDERIKTVLKPFENDFSNLEDFVKFVHEMRLHNFHFNKTIREKLNEKLLINATHDLFYLIRILLIQHIGIDFSIEKMSIPVKFRFLKTLNIKQ